MSGHDHPEQAVTFKRNGRSRWAGICMRRNFQRTVVNGKDYRRFAMTKKVLLNEGEQGIAWSAKVQYIRKSPRLVVV